MNRINAYVAIAAITLVFAITLDAQAHKAGILDIHLHAAMVAANTAMNCSS